MHIRKPLGDGVAELVSTVLSAPVVASLTFLFLLVAQSPPNLPILIAIAVGFATLIPLGVLYYLSNRNRIPDINVSRREARTLPFLLAIGSYLLGAIALYLASAPGIVTALMICYAGNSLIVMLVSFWWKISVHASGITGPATALVYSLGPGAVPFFLLLVPVGWARIRLRAHSVPQVLAGALLAVVTTWLQLAMIL